MQSSATAGIKHELVILDVWIPAKTGEVVQGSTVYVPKDGIHANCT